MTDAYDGSGTGLWQRRLLDVAFVDRGGDRVALIDLCRPEDPPVILEGPSADIWRLLKEPRALSELVGLLEETYVAPEREIRSGVLGFLRDLGRRGLVENHDAGERDD